MSIPKIFVALPVDDGSRPQFWQSLMELVCNRGDLADTAEFEFLMNPGDSLITRARNNLVHEFLKSECDYLLFLDTDIEFLPSQIKRLIEVRKEDAVVCLGYAIKQADLRMCYTRLANEDRDADGLVKVAEAGTGCMLIPRKILEAYKAKWPQLEYTCEGFKDQRVSFFDVGVVGKDKRSYKSEDWLFCLRVRQLGFSVYVDTTVIVGHWGWCKYPLTDEELIKAIASRSPTPEILRSYLDDIDKAAREKWKTAPLPASQQESKPCNPS